MLGFSYAYKGKYAAGNQMFRRYSWTNIQAQWGLVYNPTRDYEPLKQIAEVAVKYKGEELPTLDISHMDIPVINSHAQLYNEMKAILKKSKKEEQVYPDMPVPLEDDKLEELSCPEVKELASNLGKDNQLRQTKKKNNQIEL